MKRLFIPAVLVAGLSGCAVVSPYDSPYGYYSPSPVYSYPYVATPGYVVPAPMYNPPVYIGPPVHFSFGLQYWSGSRRGHGFHHGFKGHGFRHGFRGGYRGGGWKR